MRVKYLSQTIIFLLILFIGNKQVALSATAVSNIAQGRHPAICSQGKRMVHMVFEELSPSDIRDIFYTQSEDGLVWTSPINISLTPGVSQTPAIATEKSGALDVVWRDTSSGELHPNVFFARSADNGKTWSKATDISHTSGKASEPAIAVGPDDHIHVIWIDTSPKDGRPDVFYTCSVDSGKSWSPYADISPTPGISSEPTITVCPDGVIHCAWLDTTSGEERPDIFYVRKLEDAWTLPINVSNSPRLSGHPSLACNAKGKVFLCWQDNSQKKNAADIWCAMGKNGHFAKPINISDTPGLSSQPVAIANARGFLVLAWADTSKSLAKPDIYARASNDSGDDFSNVLYLTKRPGLCTFPTIALMGSKLIFSWEEAEGSIAFIKAATLELKGIATGPAEQVNPTIHRVNR